MAATPRRFPPREGADLVCLREAAGVTLQQISDATKISTGFLTAIEEGRFQDLPGGVFTRSYIRQYTAAIGCDPDPILRSLEDTAADAPARKISQRETPSALVRFFSLG